MPPIVSRADLIQRLAVATGSQGRAQRLYERAARLLGLQPAGDLSAEDLLLICEALTLEGGPVQQVAERMASDTLRDRAA